VTSAFIYKKYTGECIFILISSILLLAESTYLGQYKLVLWLFSGEKVKAKPIWSFYWKL